MASHTNLDTFTRRARSFLQTRVKSVRLAVTNASEIELLTEELTCNDEDLLPSTSGLEKLAFAAMYTTEANSILSVIQQRLEVGAKGGGKYSRMLCKTLSTVEYLLTHGPRHFATLYAERCFGSTEELCTFEHTDERGFDRGLNVRLKAHRACELLRDPELLDSERRKVERLVVERAACGPPRAHKQGFGPSKSAGTFDGEVLSTSHCSGGASPEGGSRPQEVAAEGARAAGAAAQAGMAGATGSGPRAAKGWDAFSSDRSRSLPAAKLAEHWDPFGCNAASSTRAAAVIQEESSDDTSEEHSSTSGTSADSSREEQSLPAPSATDAKEDECSRRTPGSAGPGQDTWHAGSSPPAAEARQPFPESGRARDVSGNRALQTYALRTKSDMSGQRGSVSGLKIKIASPLAQPSSGALPPLVPLSPPPQPQARVFSMYSCQVEMSDHPANRVVPNLINF